MIVDYALRRRYLLDEASEEECAAIEQAFLRDPEEQERIAAAEEGLIEDHIDGLLDEHSRQRFESHYLAAPQHRERLYTTSRLLAAAAASPLATEEAAGSERRIVGWRSPAWFAVAAAVLLIVAGAAWILSDRHTQKTGVARSAPTPPVFSPSTEAPANPPAAPAPARPQVFAITLSAFAGRSADDQPPIVIPKDAGVVSLRLEAEQDQRHRSGLICVLRTVGGVEIWRGAASSDVEAGAVARVDVPASRLPANDYIVELVDPSAIKPAPELHRYFLRVRTR